MRRQRVQVSYIQVLLAVFRPLLKSENPQLVQVFVFSVVPYTLKLSNFMREAELVPRSLKYHKAKSGTQMNEKPLFCFMVPHTGHNSNANLEDARVLAQIGIYTASNIQSDSENLSSSSLNNV